MKPSSTPLVALAVLIMALVPWHLRADDPRVSWLEANAHPLRSIDPDDDDFSDLEPLRKALAGVRIVQLGEQAHSDGATFLAKTRLIKFLHRELGFDVLAFESGIFDCRKSWESFSAGNSPLQSARLGIFGIWTLSAQVQPLIETIGSLARTKNPLEVCGFDCRFSAGGSRSLLADLETFVGPVKGKLFLGTSWDGISETLRWLMDSESKPNAAERKRGEAALERLHAGLAHSSLERVRRAEEVAFWRQVSESVLAEARQRWKYQDTRTSPPEHVNDRDAQMAKNLIWLAEERYPKRKIIVWAATFHILREAAGIKGGLDYGRTVVMGESVAKHFGDRVYSIGFSAYEGTAGNAVRQNTWKIQAPPKGSIEALLVDAGFDNAFLSFRNLGKGGAWLRKQNSLSALGYSPLRADWTRALDGLVFTKTMTPSTRAGSSPRPKPAVEDLVASVAETWDAIGRMLGSNAQYVDKNDFQVIYDGWKNSTSPSPRDIGKKMGDVEKWLRPRSKNPHCVWRVERLLAAMALDSGKRKLALKRLGKALSAYPDREYDRPSAQSRFQHLANEQAFLLWDAKSHKDSVRFIAGLLRNDRRFRYFYFDPWQERFEHNGIANGLSNLRKTIKAAYLLRAKKFPEYAEEARRFAETIR